MRSIYQELRKLADDYEDHEFSPERLGRIPTRTLLVWGDRDPLNPVNIPLEMYAAMPNASLWIVPNQGHMPLWPEVGGSEEVAATFASVVRRFLR
jgi:pimeloyl-ACP methyl ester carboxylesterase